MLKIAQDFFTNQTVKLDKSQQFENTDLFLYLKMMYGEAPVFSRNSGIIKIVEQGSELILSEHIYHDYFPGEGDGFYTIPGLALVGSRIENCELGVNLSKKGYCVIENDDKDYLGMMELMPKCRFHATPADQGMEEPYGTFKFNSVIWQAPLQQNLGGAEEEFKVRLEHFLNRRLEFSEILSSLDIFDLNILEWRGGRSMQAHNGIDYRSFVNLIVYNTEHCEKSRAIAVGEFDWYDDTFLCLGTNDYDRLMEIDKGKMPFESFEVSTKKAVLISVFNPKFYHEVGKMEGEGSLYVSTANKSFKAVTDRFEFKW